MNLESVLEDALRERAAQVRPDPQARELIARRLGRPPAQGGPRRAPLAAAAAVAATVVAVAVGAAVVAGHDSGRPRPGGRPSSTLPGYPLPPDTFFTAVAGSQQPGAATRDVIVRGSDRTVTATLPPAPSGSLTEPQLSPDGTRAYALWGRDDSRLGYLDLLTGTYHQLVRRTGELSSPTISADGRHLAYQWTPRLDGNGASRLVLRDLRRGTERVLTGLPAGAQEVSMALSPDGSRLALVPTDRSPRPLWLVGTAGAALRDPVSVRGVACRYGGWADEPRWTSAGLYAVRHCHSPKGTVITADVLQVDPQRHRARLAHRFGPGQTFFVQVVPRRAGPLFVTWDASIVGRDGVYVRDPRRGWVGQRVHGVSGLDVSGSQ